MPEQPHLPDVRRQFASLNSEGERSAMWAGFEIRDFDDDRYSVFHDAGGRDNHFQGVARVGKHLFLSGSFPYGKKRSDLFVIELGSRSADPGPWGSNLVRGGVPSTSDRLVAYYAVDRSYWHAGSFAIQGDTLIVPLEGSGGDSLVTLVDISDPAHPRRDPTDDITRAGAKGGVLTATTLPTGRLLLAVWSDSERGADGRPAPFHLDLYLASNLSKPYAFQLCGRYLPAPEDPFHRSFQGLDFVWEKSAGGEQLYLAGFENTSPTQPNPVDPGTNVAYLFQVNLPPAWLDRGFVPTAAAVPPPLGDFVSHVDDVVLSHEGDWYNMDAGASAYVDSNQQLIVYSVYHFRAPFKTGGKTKLAVKWCEFRSTDFQERIDRIEDAWVELYEGPGSGGRRLTLLGPWDSSFEDTAQCFVNDQPFRSASAARFQVPQDRAFVLYPGTGYTGEGAVVLRGNGAVRGEDLHALAPYRFSSCRFLPWSAAQSLPGAKTI